MDEDLGEGAPVVVINVRNRNKGTIPEVDRMSLAGLSCCSLCLLDVSEGFEERMEDNKGTTKNRRWRTKYEAQRMEYDTMTGERGNAHIETTSGSNALGG